MAVPKALNNLKQNGSKDDKVAVASGVAISLVVVLLFAWAIFFFRGIRNGSQNINLSAGAQNQFNFQNVTEAQQQLQQQLSSQSQQDLQNQSAQGGNGQMQTQNMQIQGNTNDQFGTGNPTY